MFCITAFDLFLKQVNPGEPYGAICEDKFFSFGASYSDLFTRVYPDLVLYYDKDRKCPVLSPSKLETIRHEFLFLHVIDEMPDLSGTCSCFIAGPDASPGWNHLTYAGLLKLTMHYAHSNKRVHCAYYHTDNSKRERTPRAFVDVEPAEVHFYFGTCCITKARNLFKTYKP